MGESGGVEVGGRERRGGGGREGGKEEEEGGREREREREVPSRSDSQKNNRYSIEARHREPENRAPEEAKIKEHWYLRAVHVPG
jgi:hypothetical protein